MHGIRIAVPISINIAKLIRMANFSNILTWKLLSFELVTCISNTSAEVYSQNYI